MTVTSDPATAGPGPGTWVPGPMARLLGGIAAGVYPPADGEVTVVPPPSHRDSGVLAVTGHTVVFADVDPAWVHSRLPAGDLSAPLNPPFLFRLSEHLGRRVNSIDLLCVARALTGQPPVVLTPSRSADHPRVARARRYRDQVTAWETDAGLIVLGRGVAGRWEVAFEVATGARGAGLGRNLATAARHLVPAGSPVWAQVAPGNAASVRVLLAAGYRPVGAEALLVRR